MSEQISEPISEEKEEIQTTFNEDSIKELCVEGSVENVVSSED